MSDDLVRQWDEYIESMGCVMGEVEHMAQKMRNRIEELEAENKLLRDAVYIDDLTVTMQASDRSKAIATIGRALDLLGADMLGEAKTTLRTTLAELTGGKDE